jgi:hypothetical protein
MVLIQQRGGGGGEQKGIRGIRPLTSIDVVDIAVGFKAGPHGMEFWDCKNTYLTFAGHHLVYGLLSQGQATI